MAQHGARAGAGSSLIVRALAFCILVVLAVFASGSAALAKTPAPPKPPPGPPAEVSALPGSTPLPELGAFAWIVADSDSGEILAAKAPRHRLPQASTTKALTALTVIPHLDQNTVYVARPKDANAEGSRVGIEAGATYTVDQLLHGLMLPSGNDAASALANANGGWEKTIAEMNAEAARLGASDTAVRNPSGLDAPGHYSTALDEVTIFRAGLELPLFRQLVGTRTAKFPSSMPRPDRKRESYDISNQDRLLMSGYPGMIGGKTGYTTHAGRTFVGAATRNGHTLLIAILRTELPLEEAGGKLLNWGFENIGKVNPLGTIPDAGEHPAETTHFATSTEAATVHRRDKVEQGSATDSQISTAVVANPSSSTSDLPWLMVALITFLTVVGVISVIRARSVVKRPR